MERTGSGISNYKVREGINIKSIEHGIFADLKQLALSKNAKRCQSGNFKQHVLTGVRSTLNLKINTPTRSPRRENESSKESVPTDVSPSSNLKR